MHGVSTATWRLQKSPL